MKKVVASLLLTAMSFVAAQICEARDAWFEDPNPNHHYLIEDDGYYGIEPVKGSEQQEFIVSYSGELSQIRVREKITCLITGGKGGKIVHVPTEQYYYRMDMPDEKTGHVFGTSMTVIRGKKSKTNLTCQEFEYLGGENWNPVKVVQCPFDKQTVQKYFSSKHVDELCTRVVDFVNNSKKPAADKARRMVNGLDY